MNRHFDAPASRTGPTLRPALFAAIALLSLACDGDEKKGDEAPPANANEAAAAKYGLTTEQASKTLATVGDVVITVGEFADRLGSQSPYLRARYHSPERRQEFLDNMIRFELLAIAAEKGGYSAGDEVERVRKQMMVQRMMSEMFDDKGVQLSDITEEEIKKYYEEHSDDFHKPAQVRASHILVKSKALATKLLEQIAAGPKDMQLFRKLAKEHNVDPETHDRLGDLRYFGEEPSDDPAETPIPAALRKAAFTLEKAGDLHPEVIKSEAGYHVLRLTARRSALDRSLDDARRLIQNRLWREKREAAIEAFVEDLRERADVREDLTLLSKVSVEVSEQGEGGEGTGEDDGAGAEDTGDAKTDAPKKATADTTEAAAAPAPAPEKPAASAPTPKKPAAATPAPAAAEPAKPAPAAAPAEE